MPFRIVPMPPPPPASYLDAIERAMACGALTEADRRHLIDQALVTLLDIRAADAMQIGRLLVAQAREVGR